MCHPRSLSCRHPMWPFSPAPKQAAAVGNASRKQAASAEKAASRRADPVAAPAQRHAREREKRATSDDDMTVTSDDTSENSPAGAEAAREEGALRRLSQRESLKGPQR